jgi:hypothetical protein
MVEEASYVTKEFLKKTDTVCKLISEIDPEYKLLDFIISHRVGKISQPGSFNHNTKQIIVHLADKSDLMRSVTFVGSGLIRGGGLLYLN